MFRVIIIEKNFTNYDFSYTVLKLIPDEDSDELEDEEYSENSEKENNLN